MVTLLLFAAARDAAGRRSDSFLPGPLDEILATAEQRYGAEFSSVLATARVWVDGEEPADGPATPVAAGSEVAVLPPVSGGAVLD